MKKRKGHKIVHRVHPVKKALKKLHWTHWTIISLGSLAILLGIFNYAQTNADAKTTRSTVPLCGAKSGPYKNNYFCTVNMGQGCGDPSKYFYAAGFTCNGAPGWAVGGPNASQSICCGDVSQSNNDYTNNPHKRVTPTQRHYYTTPTKVPTPVAAQRPIKICWIWGCHRLF